MQEQTIDSVAAALESPSSGAPPSKLHTGSLSLLVSAVVYTNGHNLGLCTLRSSECLLHVILKGNFRRRFYCC